MGRDGSVRRGARASTPSAGARRARCTSRTPRLLGGADTAYGLGAIGDLDGDGAIFSDFGYIHPDAGGATQAPGNNACADTGVYNAATNAADLLNTVGPCGSLDGQDEF